MVLAGRWVAGWSEQPPTAPERVSFAGGLPPSVHAWNRFHAHYYVMALLFLTFDMEMAYMFPWAVVFRSEGMVAIGEIFVLISVLACLRASARVRPSPPRRTAGSMTRWPGRGRRSWWSGDASAVTPTGCPEATIVGPGGDIEAVICAVHRELLTAQRASESPLLPDIDPAPVARRRTLRPRRNRYDRAG